MELAEMQLSPLNQGLLMLGYYDSAAFAPDNQPGGVTFEN